MIVFLLLFLGCFANYQRFYEHGHLIHWVDLGESPSPLRIHHDQGHYLSDLSTVYPNSVLINGSFFYVSEGQHHPVYYLQINKLPYVLASAGMARLAGQFADTLGHYQSKGVCPTFK